MSILLQSLRWRPLEELPAFLAGSNAVVDFYGRDRLLQHDVFLW